MHNVYNYIHMYIDETIDEMPLTTIRIQTTTRDELTELGKKGESYDTVIRKLIEEHKQHQKEAGK